MYTILSAYKRWCYFHCTILPLQTKERLLNVQMSAEFFIAICIFLSTKRCPNKEKIKSQNFLWCPLSHQAAIRLPQGPIIQVCVCGMSRKKKQIFFGTDSEQMISLKPPTGSTQQSNWHFWIAAVLANRYVHDNLFLSWKSHRCAKWRFSYSCATDVTVDSQSYCMPD